MKNGKNSTEDGQNKNPKSKKRMLFDESCCRIPLPDARSLFDTEGTTYGAIYGMAEAIGARMQESPGRLFCVASQERPILAASLLASFTGYARIVVPYGLSPRILAEGRETMSFDHVIIAADDENRAPEDVVVYRMEQRGHFALQPPPFGGDPEETFCYLYTGGSTGRPKAWSKSPASLFGEGEFLVRRFGLEQGDVILSTVPALHIYGLLFTVIAVMAAGCCVSARQPFMPAEVEEMLADESVTVFVSGPAHYRLLRDSEIRSPGLRLGFSSGGMLDSRDGANFHAKTGVGVTEVYGSTETGGIACRQRALGEDEWTVFPDVLWTTRAVDEGEELLVNSRFLSTGLLLEDGFFPTGDIVIPVDENRFSLVGRADGIVKVGGKRVDLLEVKQKISSIEGVRDCHVATMPRTDGRSVEIVALVSGSVESGKIRQLLGKDVSPLAMPRRIIKVNEIPTTPTGKRDGRAIENLIRDESDSGSGTENQD